MSKFQGVTILAATVMTLVGCDSNKDVTYGSIKSDLSPELVTMTERSSDMNIHVAETNQQNGRMIWDDLGRAFYTDRPSFLSPLPIVPATGIPR